MNNSITLSASTKENYTFYYCHINFNCCVISIMVNATTDDVTMDALDALIAEPIETIRYSKKKGPVEHTIHNILRKERNLIAVRLADINDRLTFLIKEGKLKNQSPNGKSSYFIINNNPDTSHESVSETDNVTPTTTACPCINDLNSIKDHIRLLNNAITALRSFILEQMIIFKKSAPPVSDIYPKQNSQYINVLLEQIHHLCQESENKTCIIQALNENQNDFQNITNLTQKSRKDDFKRTNITDKHAEDHVINISD